MKNLVMQESDFRALVQLARRIDFLSPLSNPQLEELLSRIALYEYPSGDNVFNKGDLADAFYIVYEGKVAVEIGRRFFGLFPKVIKLGPGSLLGEMGLLERRPRSATVRAKAKTKLFVLLHADFNHLVKQNPAFADHVRRLATQRTFEAAHRPNPD